MAMRSWATAPWKPQRAGMTHHERLEHGFVVIGTMSPPSTTWGMSAIGVSAIAASAEATTVDSRSPSAAAFIETTTIAASSIEEGADAAVEAEREEHDAEEHACTARCRPATGG